jgi:FMN-dependent NADH-azoreductase
LIYSNKNNPYDEFLISVEVDHIIISAPMPNSNMTYKSSVKTYWDASEYLQSHLENYKKYVNKSPSLATKKEYNSD